jgi:hypothetical protein
MGSEGIIVGVKAEVIDSLKVQRGKERPKYRIAMVARPKSTSKSLHHLFSGAAGVLERNGSAAKEEEREEERLQTLPIKTIKQRLQDLGMDSDGCTTKVELVHRLARAQSGAGDSACMNIELAKVVVADLLTRSKTRDMGPADLLGYCPADAEAHWRHSRRLKVGWTGGASTAGKKTNAGKRLQQADSATSQPTVLPGMARQEPAQARPAPRSRRAATGAGEPPALRITGPDKGVRRRRAKRAPAASSK